MGSGYAHSGSLWEGEWEEVIRTQVHQGVDLGALLALPRGKTGTLMLPENAKANLRFRVRCPPPPFPSFCSAISPVTQLSTSVVETEDGGGRRPSAHPPPPHTSVKCLTPPDLPVLRPRESPGITFWTRKSRFPTALCTRSCPDNSPRKPGAPSPFPERTTSQRHPSNLEMQKSRPRLHLHT